ncbi:MAG TPA: transposase [Sulfurihydrogenibium sp.]|uniref:RNA-guided endonuclease TnpB family protein n=1 Tax=Sulfurihydrogenibium sp. (strain YO3AOP1) TaxID=436114 RepID=UPI0001724D5E|nr:RNA-guided endonuclease TnpB family protein [Sulfurihydrogenibium sp. YO3AOP1]ACD67315.1 transposase, IS605 OrfB family [Sulfurihydrogenibium sp. YO3AOP1]HBT99277.1 transposase [Sulfurihydrogenibium sp.]
MKNSNKKKKNSKKELSQNTELRVFSIRIKNDKLEKELKHLLFTYKHFENILLILISQNYNLYKDGKDTNDFKLLTSPQLMRNALYDYNSKHSTQLEYLKNKYKDNQLWQALKETAKKLKPHNVVEIIKRVKANFKTYFTNLETYKQNPNLFTGMPKPPKPKKLSKIIDYSVELDKYNSLSFTRLEKENLVGINLSDHMVYIHIDKRQIEKLAEVSKLYSARLVYDNDNLYLQISYLKNISRFTSHVSHKYASIDIGVNNLMAVFVDDETTSSLIVDGKPFKDYNSKFNRLIPKLNESKSKEVAEWAVSKTGSKYPAKYTEKGKKIGKFISYLYAKRNRFFHDQFHKMAKRVVEYLYLHGITDLFISRNLAELKNNGECNLDKATKQSFIQIPFIKLLQNIEYKAQEYGINVHYVDERYTSKASCISDDIESIQESPDLTNAFNGRRVKRGLFLDTIINKVFNADINGAVNHIKVATGKSFRWLKNKLFKLCNPIKIKSDYEFCRLLKNLQNSGSGNSVPFIGVEASQSNKLIENISFC